MRSAQGADPGAAASVTRSANSPAPRRTKSASLRVVSVGENWLSISIEAGSRSTRAVSVTGPTMEPRFCWFATSAGCTTMAAGQPLDSICQSPSTATRVFRCHPFSWSEALQARLPDDALGTSSTVFPF